jgi:hypothetical protein
MLRWLLLHTNGCFSESMGMVPVIEFTVYRAGTGKRPKQWQLHHHQRTDIYARIGHCRRAPALYAIGRWYVHLLTGRMLAC